MTSCINLIGPQRTGWAKHKKPGGPNPKLDGPNAKPSGPVPGKANRCFATGDL